MTQSSFYADGETYDTAVVESNDVPASIENSQAPSGFYPNGNVYDELTPEGEVLTTMTALRNQAAASQAAAATSEANADDSEAQALAHKNAAATSAAAALVSENNADASEAAAANSETNAATSAANADTSEANAATSASTATTQAGIATTKASEAATSAAAALVSEGNADTSEANAASSASTASTQAGIATTQAGIATTQAGISTTQAGIATTKAGEAATSATNAATSETNADTSEANAATSASTATTQAGIATTKAGEAATSASTASTAATNATNAYNSFRGIYYGSASSDPSLDPNGAAPGAGDFYFNTTTQKFRAYNGSSWADMVAGGAASRYRYTATAGQTTFSGADGAGLTLNYTVGSVEVIVNGLWLPYNEYTATSGTSIVLSAASVVGDNVYVFALSNFSVADALAKTSNGSDILDKPTFRSNLGLGAYATAATGQLPGTGGSNVPAAGMIGERLSASGSLNLTSGSSGNIASLTLGTGVYDIEWIATFGGPGATSSSDWITAVSTTSGTVGTNLIDGGAAVIHNRRPAGGDISECHASIRFRVNPSTSTTYYLNAQATFTASTYSVNGKMIATRVS
jgi:hypothetical protein